MWVYDICVYLLLYGRLCQNLFGFLYVSSEGVTESVRSSCSCEYECVSHSKVCFHFKPII